VTLTIDWYEGPREAIRWLFEEAEDSRVQLDAYIGLGRVLLAKQDGHVVGELQLIPTAEAPVWEVKSLAVAPQSQGQGIGRALVKRAISEAGAEAVSRLTVSTATADVGNLRFYQRCGFRMLSIERDAFTPATGYPEPIDIDGVPLRDRIWLDLDLSDPGPGSSLEGRTR
jgi:GNAT superfamily N-acetyltransferase